LTRERLHKILAKAGIASRRAAEMLVQEGRVEVNGMLVTRPEFKADPLRDRIRVDGKPLKRLEPKVYILLNKPRGILCTRNDPYGRPIVTDLIRGGKFRLYPVGRLDADSEGLLLLTNDGDFFHRLVHPKYETPRVYLVKVKGKPDAEDIRRLKRGMYLSDGPVRPAEVGLARSLKINSWWTVVVREGRNRLVRRMFEKIGHPVLRLIRIKFGPLRLGELKPGQYRHLSREEVDLLLTAPTPIKPKPQKVRTKVEFPEFF
jgi:pseudouridine synthase